MGGLLSFLGGTAFRWLFGEALDAPTIAGALMILGAGLDRTGVPQEELAIERTADILALLGRRKRPGQVLVGFAAETGGGVTILALSHAGIPVSTTHTITGAIVGVGATRGTRAVRWGVAGRIIWAWIFTIPASAIVAALIYLLVRAALHLGT